MREIRFRAWDTQLNKMLDWSFFYGVGMQVLNGKTAAGNWMLMQYTGLHDRNGKEIYEGDIIRKNPITRSPTIHKILFVDACFCLSEKYFEAVALRKYIRNRQIKFFEVIGNIYEAPELLEIKSEQN